ncbi:NAD+ synthase [Candidatus Gottesmanbacteria bacterium]|nr:NAD+ synthase [Candidatus Gottesmanbacteria bacterium]
MFNSFNPQLTSEKIVNFLKQEVSSSGLSDVILALSGGIDSTTVAYLLSQAFDKKNIYILLMPYKNLNPKGLADSKKVISQLNLLKDNFETVDISKIADGTINTDPKMDDIRRGNIMARARMIVLFDRAKKHKALVIGTENKSEHLLSYYTRFGDEASDLEPIRGLYKTQVKMLAKYLGVPNEFIKKPPTAGLWEGQTDEGQFGFSYSQADIVLHAHFDLNYSKEKIENLGIKKETINKILDWVKANDFKHHLPKVCK